MQLALQKSKISVLLPDSFLENEDTLLLKTRKIGTLARTTTMFRIGHVYFYKESGLDKDRKILGDICTHLSLPPYLRKYGPHSPNLRYTAVLPPVHSPSHFGVEYKTFSYSEGIVIEKFGDKISVDIGKKTPLNILNKGYYKKGDSVIIQSANKSIEVQDKIPDSIFWKTLFEIGDLTLDQYMQSNPRSYVIALSKSGKSISSNLLLELQNSSHSHFLLVFGPIKGSLRDYVKNLNSIDKWINIIPNQGTKTIKIEEAVQSALTLINLCSLNLK
ncbi:MAG: putative RNA uridine N3 methyltransferase [Promethearchaeota archaeon]